MSLHTCPKPTALGDIDVHSAWQEWHLWPWAGSGGALGSGVRRRTLRERRGAWWHRPSLCVARVALGDIDLHFAWQAWRLWLYTPLHKLLSPTTLLHGTLSHSSLRYAFLAHTDPPPSLVSFLPFPSHLHLSLATCWKKLTCGVIRSFNSSKNESKRTKPRTPVPGQIIANIMVLGTLQKD